MLHGSEEDNRKSTRDFLWLVGLVFIVYGTSLASNLLTDDLILTRNARLIPWSLGELCTSFRLQHPDYTAGWLPVPFNGFVLQYFRPVIMASIKMDYSLWGTWAPGFHLTNILIYSIMVWLVWVWAGDFGLKRRDRFLAGAFFILFAPNQMAVNVIASRTELIADVFLLASIMLLGRFYTNRSPLYFLGALLAGVLALGSKENSVMLPVLHGVAALFLYTPGKDPSKSWAKVRILALLPFVLMVPCYFYVRAAVLGGFPMPLKGFYFHHPLDPGFTAFVVSKVIHAALTLVYQVPIFFPPILMQYSLPTAVITGLIAVVTLVAMYRGLKPPFRYFMLFWIVACIAPTLPMGLNPIYYFMCSPVMAVFYVILYRRFATSPIRWQAKTTRVLLISMVVFGVLNGIGGGIHFRLLGAPSRAIAQGTVALLEKAPAVESVFLFDLPFSAIDTVPAIRLGDESYSSKRFYLLAPRANLLDTSPCEIRQVDAYAFDIRPTNGVLFKTGIEETFVGNPIPEFKPGMKAVHPDYEIEVIEAEPSVGPEGPDLWTRVRNHYRMPPASQNGVSILRFRFKEPLAAQDRLFLQADEQGVTEIHFLSEEDLHKTEPNWRPVGGKA